MTDEELWARIKSIREKTDMTEANFKMQKSRGRLAPKWVYPIFNAVQGTDLAIPLERLHEISQ